MRKTDKTTASYAHTAYTSDEGQKHLENQIARFLCYAAQIRPLVRKAGE